MDLWPLLSDDLLDGARSIERHLRPRAVAVAVDATSVADATEVVTKLCADWGGGAMPLAPISPGSGTIDNRMLRVLQRSNIDGIKARELLPKEIEDEHSDQYAAATQFLLRQLVELDFRPKVQTVHGVSPDDPWYLSYLGTFGNLPSRPDRERNRRFSLRVDLTFNEVVDVEKPIEQPSARDLLERVRDPQRMSALELTRTRLPAGFVGGYNRSISSESRFSPPSTAISSAYGPNILVVYEPGSVSDLGLIWNLRARFAHPSKLPLAVPLTDTIESDLAFFSEEHSGHHFFGLGHDLAVTSCSVPRSRLKELARETDFDVVSPWDLLGDIHGYCITSTEIAQFTDGKATVSSFSPTDIKELGQEYLGSSDASWLTLTTTVQDRRLPFSPTMRRTRWQQPGYLGGSISHVGKLDGFTTLHHPSGLEVLRALANDRSLQVRTSTPGKAAEHLIRAAGGELSMFAHPGVTKLLTDLPRRGHASMVKRRLNQYLAGTDDVPGTERYEVLSAKLDAALGAPELDEVGYMNFNKLRQTLGFSPDETKVWVDWAVRSRIILRGVEAKCARCGHKQWRPLADMLPELTCHGCGRIITDPFGPQKIDYQYRASEILLRAMSHDVLPSILAARHIGRVLDGRAGPVFGMYPGVELLEKDSNTVIAEIDLLVVLTNGEWLVGECKNQARGLNDVELCKLWTAADRVNSPTTFAVTLDKSENCSDLWKGTEDPNGRPHFSLTAEHLYDLQTIGPAYGEEFFAWRDDFPRWPHDAEQDSDALVNKRFGNYLLRKDEDPGRRARAPWDSSDS